MSIFAQTHLRFECPLRSCAEASNKRKGKMCLNEQTGAFGPETISILDRALDGAWQSLENKSQLNDNLESARTVLAKHIVDMAKNGERDRQRLIDAALARFRL